MSLQVPIRGGKPKEASTKAVILVTRHNPHRSPSARGVES